jgi:protein SCO1/2
MARNTHIAALVIGLLSGTAIAHPDGTSPSDKILPPPPTYKANGVTVDEHVGQAIPLDTAFRTSDGKRVTLGELLTGELPTILTFNYSDCPMLCSLQLNGLSSVLPKIAEPVDMDGPDGTKTVAFRTGGQFRIITIDLEPNESLEKLAKMKERYIAKLPEAQRPPAEKGWTFLAAATPGDGAAIRRVAESVGFKYVYVEDRAEWAHPAALIFLSTTGVVTRYVYGIEYDPKVMRESIVKAGLAEPATAVGFMNRCYHFDPDANSHTRAGVLALRLGAAGFLVLLVTGLGFIHVRRRRHFLSRSTPGES